GGPGHELPLHQGHDAAHGPLQRRQQAPGLRPAQPVHRRTPLLGGAEHGLLTPAPRGPLPMQPQRRFLMAGLAGAAVLPPLAAAASSPAPTAQPLHADHAQGRTVLPAAPRRVAVYDLAALDMLLALGIEPVGVPQVTPPAYLRAI